MKHIAGKTDIQCPPPFENLRGDMIFVHLLRIFTFYLLICNCHSITKHASNEELIKNILITKILYKILFPYILCKCFIQQLTNRIQYNKTKCKYCIRLWWNWEFGKDIISTRIDYCYIWGSLNNNSVRYICLFY